MKIFSFLLGILLFLASCEKNKKEDFNRAVMLENYADNIILSNIILFFLSILMEVFLYKKKNVSSKLFNALPVQRIKKFSFMLKHDVVHGAGTSIVKYLVA